jgi:hypothetical protein
VEGTRDERERPAPEAEVRVEQSAVRCPFCHGGIEVQAEKWVACSSCLARHHAECATESHACASCGAESFLRTASPAAPRVRSVAADVALGYLTLGIYPIVRSELDLAAHDERHAEGEGLGHGKLGARHAVAIGIFVVAMAALSAFLAVYGKPPPQEMPTLQDAVFSLLVQLTIMGPVLAQLHLLREGLRRHEERTLGPDASGAWRERRRMDLEVTALAVVPFVGVLALFLASARVRGALDLHEEHERRKKKPGGKPSGKP